MRLAHKTAIVTGAGRGIGRAIALAFAREGAAVGLLARTTHEIDAVAHEIDAAGGRAIALPADVSDQAAVEAAVLQTCATFGSLDILVNNAAISATVDFVHDSFDTWNRIVQINLYGAIYCARAAAQTMIAQAHGGRLINISSIHGYRAEAGTSHYDVAKGGLDQLTRTLAVELAPHSIFVNGIAPGFIDTAMSSADGVNELETDWFQQIYVQRRKIPLARAGMPNEVASAAVFLAAQDASSITGHTLVVDGGLSVTF